MPALVADGRRHWRPPKSSRQRAGTGVVTEALHHALPGRGDRRDRPQPADAGAGRATGRPGQRELPAGRCARLAVRRGEFRPRRLPVRNDVLPGQGERQCRSVPSASPGRAYLVAIWDRVDRNLATRVAGARRSRSVPIQRRSTNASHSAISTPPSIEGDLRSAGFTASRSRRLSYAAAQLRRAMPRSGSPRERRCVRK